ncbi:ABC transporter ATP-binding protein [Ramlibacter tataouinensis]|uniref:Candidate ABC type polysaccharide/polyol phosphate export systems that might be involved in cell envelope biogenesis, ATP-binding component n=1 Tax=Ramlibacter tataouinensis (strain ATCC BAA-407 / DSM 14655 / LMG 21543 / TTB310) TaxID=365046 RepID=F5XYW7_RAMTT|nr:ABC transporter ATP-binding protein [Ramlibacter tataouinensis]AEG91955.1 candidate ABC type polysaccharide/polyol phosphate export systems that might be involved in cell envelope biogenesis, ATP-binding component [Ramlibacter tataouinensis TTB310]
MSSEPIIEVQGLAKAYQIYNSPRDRLRQLVALGGRKHYREYLALNGLSFAVTRGETLGVIGRNGAGKSTLLQLICGTLSPTAGSIAVRGRVAALLELGAGFNPEFTGRENIAVAGALYGLSRQQVEERMERILSFAEIGAFVDQPVKTYSSGMFVRLAFALIAHVDADVLVVDEALAVGDVYFQQKCMRFLRRFQEGGGTMLFVSHDTAAVMNLCRTALWLRQPSAGDYVLGPAETVCKAYLQDFYARQEESLRSSSPLDAAAAPAKDDVIEWLADPFAENMVEVSPYNHAAESFGQGGGRFVSAGFHDPEGRLLTTLRGGDQVVLRLQARMEQPIADPAFGITIKDRLGQFIFSESTDSAFRSSRPVFAPGDVVTVEFSFRMPILLQGHYTLDIAFAEGLGHEHTQHHWVHDALVLTSLRGRLVQGICGLPDLAVRLSRHPAREEAL